MPKTPLNHPVAPEVTDNRSIGIPLWGMGLALPAFILLAVARRYGLVAHVPLWLIAGELFITLFVMAVFTSRFPPGSERARPRTHLFLQIALIGVIVYSLGWGSVLAVGFLFPATNIMSSDGSKLRSWAMVCIGFTVTVGECAVRLGFARSIVEGSSGYGLAMLEFAGTCAVIWVLAYNQREKEQVERTLANSERRFRALVQHASDIIMVVTTHATISYVSPAFEAILGYSVTDAIGMDARTLLSQADLSVLRDITETPVQGAAPHRSELRLRHCDGSWRWFEVIFTNLFDAPGIHGWVANLRDITQRKRTSDQLAYQAAHDGMTGLANRSNFTDRVTAALSNSTGTIAVLFLDLDHFKLINDGLGHAAGDNLLVQVAERLRNVIRPGDAIARFGGDEFVVLCEQVSRPEDATKVAHRLMDAMTQPLVVSGDEVYVSASIGIALSNSGDSAEVLLRQADAAMYRAKNEGRSRVVIYNPDHHGSAATLLRTGSELHRALERNEFVLHYQPIVDLESGRVIGFEALLRWNHPERGLLMPAEFLRLAEETDLILPIGKWVLEEACRQTVHWQQIRHPGVTAAAPLNINVNLAARQVADPNLGKTVAQVIEETEIEPSALCLELTESTLMYDTDATLGVLYGLRQQGVTLSIDDFGTGYSSLSYLRHFPVATLKIDKSFVDGLLHGFDDARIVETIITLAHSLGVAAVAEGLESPSQLQVLRRLGCDFAQGYLFGRPLPVDAINDHPADNLTAWQQSPLSNRY